MTLENALQRVFELLEQLPPVEEEGNSGCRIGPVFINTSRWQRGLEPCPYCGSAVLMGVITVKHDDGRSVSFTPKLGHYVEVGHPLEMDENDRETLIAIMTDV